jgi:hypothetical protein
MKILLGALFLVTVVTGCNTTCPQGARPASDFTTTDDISNWCPSNGCLTGNYTVAGGTLADGGTVVGGTYIQCYTAPTPANP